MPLNTITCVIPQQLFVLCWAYENRLEERGGVGYSFHTTQEKADEWVNNRGEKIENHQPGFAVIFVCGKGLANNEILSPEGVGRIKAGDGSMFLPDDGLFSEKLPTWLTLTEGVWPGHVTHESSESAMMTPD